MRSLRNRKAAPPKPAPELVLDSDEDDDLALSPPSFLGAKGHKVAVVIPPACPSKAPSVASASGTSAFSVNTAVDRLTPDTSTTGTPFGLQKTSTKKAAISNLGKVDKELSTWNKGRARQTPLRSASRRGRNDQLDADEQLAKQLQEAEYDDPVGKSIEETSAKRYPRGRPRFLNPVDDTDNDDDLPLLSTHESDDEFEFSGADEDDDSNEDPDSLGSAHQEPVVKSRRGKAKAKAKAKAKVAVPDTMIFDDSEDDVPLVNKRKAGSSPDASRKRSKVAKAARRQAYEDALDRSIVNSDNDSDDLSSITSVVVEPVRRQRRGARSAHGAKPAGMSRSDWERRKLETSHPALATLWKNLEDENPIIPVQAQQPPGINRSLKSFQLEGLNWMMRMETEGRWKGGLLGDEMGMGKTIQAVSLIMSDFSPGKVTLVVVPPVALMQWSAEIKAYTDGKLKVLIYHNADPKVKKLKIADLKKYDVIMVSYNGLESSHRKEVEGFKREDGLVKENSKIHAMHFHRLILDEAHSIKSRTTKVARSCFALKSDRKWCLSGTPVQNRIGEFFSLLRFLEVTPFASYFCKECDCEAQAWEQNEAHECVHCNHRGFDHVSIFNQEILNPVTSGDPQDRAEGMRKLRLLTDRVMLRRLKRDHTAQMELPPKMVVVHREFFSAGERDFNKSIMTNSTREFDTYVARGVMLNNYANIFGLIMQMRQSANHPDLITKKHAEGGQNILVCCICDEAAEEPIRSQCRHEFCRSCAKEYYKTAEKPECPACHIALKIDFDQPDIEQDEDAVKKSSIINRIDMKTWHSSTKIEMLIYNLYKLRSKKYTVKSIVFSQFTSMLQLINWRLHRAGFNTVMLDGSMTPQQRQNSINHFMTNVDCEVFLVSLKAGGVALNLTEASHVFIVDPWWNPAAEWQSADRVHRIGQRRPCVITRLVIEDSVESRMVLLQEKKANMINSTINKDDVALEKLTAEDLQFLFRGS